MSALSRAVGVACPIGFDTMLNRPDYGDNEGPFLVSVGHCPR